MSRNSLNPLKTLNISNPAFAGIRDIATMVKSKSDHGSLKKAFFMNRYSHNNLDGKYRNNSEIK
jgi:hypothetical protein